MYLQMSQIIQMVKCMARYMFEACGTQKSEIKIRNQIKKSYLISTLGKITYNSCNLGNLRNALLDKASKFPSLRSLKNKFSD